MKKKMSRNSLPMRRAAALSLLLILAAACGIARGQDQVQDSGLRTVYGDVLDKSENPIRDAVIYLKNDRNLTVRTYISNLDGKYRFSGLDPNVDYEIHAEHEGLTSSNRTISSFDSRKEMNVTLKVDKPKKSEK
jgi:hypothetical protein